MLYLPDGEVVGIVAGCDASPSNSVGSDVTSVGCDVTSSVGCGITTSNGCTSMGSIIMGSTVAGRGFVKVIGVVVATGVLVGDG